MAAAHGQPFAYTLTGFKWIGRVPGLAFGYEEAIGYCVDPAAVPDKDGISALIRVLALAAELKATGSHAGRTGWTRSRPRYGVYETDQLSVRVADLGLIAAAMARLRAAATGRARRRAGGGDRPGRRHGRAAAHRRGAADPGESLKVVVRPSGTEPKLKCYLEARLPPTPRRRRARTRGSPVRGARAALVACAPRCRSPRTGAA